MEILEAVILGIIQGITEWLPISSEGINSLVMVNFFNKGLNEAILISLWLHLGTLMAAVVFFKDDIKKIITDRKTHFRKLNFLIIATLVSVIIGGGLFFYGVERFNLSGKIATILISSLLIVMGILQLITKKHGKMKRIENRDAVISGIGQGFAVLPGISRSGITTSFLLLRDYSGKQALKLSFLMSIPAVIVAIVAILIFGKIAFNLAAFIALALSFVFGLLTIKIFLKVAEKVNFGWFCMLIGLLGIISWAL